MCCTCSNEQPELQTLLNNVVVMLCYSYVVISNKSYTITTNSATHVHNVVVMLWLLIVTFLPSVDDIEEYLYGLYKSGQ